jgi:hypothetical protein
MHPILAENIDGWLFGAAVLFGGLIASVLALCALVPARQRNRRLTFTLAAPALVVGLLVTLWAGYGFITDGLHDPDYSVSDFAIPWLVMAGPSFATSLLAIIVLGLSTRKGTDAQPSDAVDRAGG